jgi:hypothetical protein
VSALARTRPYFGIDVLRAAPGIQERFDFIDSYLKELIREPHSALYAELFNNQNIGLHRYDLSESNRLLYFFLSDTKAAKENHVYKAIGDFAITHLREIGRHKNSDPYNRVYDSDFDVEKWNSPIFAVIRFFDIMVREALFQGTEWHMWLYYIPDIVEGMLRNYAIVDPQTDIDSEWPTRYSYLLYEAISMMCDWVKAVEGVPPNQANATLQSRRADHENGNIPKSSILALSQCARHILVSESIDQKLKQYLMDIIFRLYFDLRENGNFDNYAEVLTNALSQGGFYRPRSDDKYHRALVDAFEAEEDEYRIKYSEDPVDELGLVLRGTGAP